MPVSRIEEAYQLIGDPSDRLCPRCAERDESDIADLLAPPSVPDTNPTKN